MEHPRVNDERIDKLLTGLGELRGCVEKGFEEVTKRQDITNGKVLKNEADIIELKNADKTTDEFRKGVIDWSTWGLRVVLGTIIIAVLVVIGIKTK